MPVRFVPNERARLSDKEFPPEDVQALWHMWPTVLTLRWYPGIARFYLVDHEFGVESNFEAEEAADYDFWLRILKKLECERERRRSKLGTDARTGT